VVINTLFLIISNLEQSSISSSSHGASGGGHHVQVCNDYAYVIEREWDHWGASILSGISG